MSDWFPLHTLDVPDEPVVYRSVEGLVRGVMKQRRGGRPEHWVVLDRSTAFKVPDGNLSGWRPVDENRWPGVLPEPIQPFPQSGMPIAGPQEAAEADSGSSWWVGSQITLKAAGERPVSVLECEARILRGLATIRVLQAIEKRSRAAPPNWPRDLLIEAGCVLKMLRGARTGTLAWLRAEDYDDFHVDRSALPSTAARFEPTERDIEDACGAVNWLDDRDIGIVRLRSFNPPYSFREIGERIGRTHTTARGRYYDAIERAWRRAR